ncbi:MAG TPA: hypothetical protein VF846_15215 [Thermoanaerobaculia bacterium]|jgi:hypothetical protein
MTKTLAVAFAAAMLLMPSKAAALENEELLTLVAMPLAVAAVSEIADVPVSDLIDAVTVLNDAAVPPEQFIEVVRYIPVALVNEVTVDEPRFVDYIRTQEQQGVRGTDLVNAIEAQLAVYGYNDVELAVNRPRTIDVTDTTFVPKIVRTRLAEVRAHPHGGPPGQLKKQRGVKTGAAIVHDRSDDASNRVVTRVVEDRDRDTASEPRKPRKQRITTHEQGAPKPERAAKQKDEKGRGRGHESAAHGNGHGHGNGGGDKGNAGNGKGKGKG